MIPTVARSGKGKKELMATVGEKLKDPDTTPFKISYGDDIDNALDAIEEKIRNGHFLTDIYQARWTALKYLEKDNEILELGQKENPSLSKEIERMVQSVSDHLSETLDTYPEAIIADHRYGYITNRF